MVLVTLGGRVDRHVDVPLEVRGSTKCQRTDILTAQRTEEGIQEGFREEVILDLNLERWSGLARQPREGMGG